MKKVIHVDSTQEEENVAYELKSLCAFYVPYESTLFICRPPTDDELDGNADFDELLIKYGDELQTYTQVISLSLNGITQLVKELAAILTKRFPE
jgi:hypothetical protein